MNRRDNVDAKVSDARVTFCRLAVAFAVSLKMYTRMAVDGYGFGSVDAEMKRMSLGWQ